MSAPADPAPPPPPGRTRGRSVGRIVAGLLILALGVGWLLEILGVDVPWDLVFPGVLIVIGAALLLVARRGTSQAALITVGIVLTIVLLVGSAVDVPLGGGVGARTVRPSSYAAIRASYRLGVGELTVDLSAVRDLPAIGGADAKTVSARVGIGHLVVIVPTGGTFAVVGRAGLGNVRVYGLESSGVDATREIAPPGSVVVSVNAAVGLGQVEVRRG